MMRDAVHTAAAPRMPFIGRIASHQPGRHIVVERALTLARDLHLADHHFVPARPFKPLAACYPVLPLTFSLEAMAEVAACLAPGMGLTGFADVSAARWIALADAEGMDLHIEARLVRADEEKQSARLAATIRVAGDPRPAISATLLFGRHYVLGLHPAFASLAPAGEGPVTLDAADIYASRQLFHGATLRCLEGAVSVGGQGAAATLVVRAPERLFAGDAAPLLLTDPALMDGVGQLIGIWAMQSRQRVTFPIGVGRLEYYAATPPPGSRVPIRIQTTVQGKLLSTDVEIGDGAGGVWLRVRDWKSWQFQWDGRLLAFRRQPRRHLLSMPLAVPAALALTGMVPEGGAGRHTAAIMPATPVWQSMEASAVADFDRALLARHYLHMDEMAAFEAKAAQPARQLEWLLGRIAAKDAARRWAADAIAGTDTDADADADARVAADAELAHPASFSIENDASGRPRLRQWPLACVAPCISIAHSGGRALAAAHRGPIGVDIERVAPRGAPWADAFSGADERRWGPAAGTDASADEWLTRLWCAKEALGKLLGTAVRPSPHAFVAVGRDADGSLLMRQRDSGRMARVACWRDGEFICALGLESGAHAPSNLSRVEEPHHVATAATGAG